MGTQEFQFLAAAAEHERVAALEADHPAAGTGMLQHQGVDLFLRHAVLAGGLADLHPQCGRRGQCQYLRADQAVVQQHLGRLQCAQGVQGQQAGITRTGADQGDRTRGQLESGGGRWGRAHGRVPAGLGD